MLIFKVHIQAFSIKNYHMNKSIIKPVQWTLKFSLIAVFVILNAVQVYAQNVLSPTSYLGYAVGTKFTRHHQIVSYFNTVAQAKTDMVKIIPYGKTNEGRDLFVAAIGVAAYMHQQEESVTEPPPPLQVLPAEVEPAASSASAAEEGASSASAASDRVVTPVVSAPVASAPMAPTVPAPAPAASKPAVPAASKPL